MLQLPRLYAILDAACFPNTEDLLSAAEELASAGCTLLQYRNKSGHPRQMLEQARELKTLLDGWSGGCPRLPATIQNAPGTRATAASRPIRLIMNDRADFCLAAEFDGVHVGQDDLSPESVRAIVGPDRWVGVSTHNPGQLAETNKTSVDYLAIGPIFATSSKKKPDPVLGLEGLRCARQLTGKPLVAIGGITRSNAASVIEAGADSVAVISDLLREPRKSAEEFFRILR